MSEFKRSLLTFLPHHGIDEDHISDFNILERFLSSIRLQRNFDSCLFVAMAACLEMMLRILGIQVPSWDKTYFLDVRDAIDRLCQIYSVADGTGPITMEIMLAFVTNYGFKVTSLCKKPGAVDHLANFDDEALRCRIHGHSMLEESEVLKYVEKFPIIAGVYHYMSMMFCTQAFYGGPTECEKMTKGSFKNQHSVLIVGSMKVDMRSGTQIYLIVQNSWSNTNGVSGFMMLPFDCSNIFTVFVLPHIDTENFPTEKWRMEHFNLWRDIDANVVGCLKKERLLVLCVLMTLWIWIPHDEFGCFRILPHSRSENDRGECGSAGVSGGGDNVAQMLVLVRV